LEKSYIHADGQILSQVSHGAQSTDVYYYVHDRLGSVRMVVGYDGQTASVVNGYAYRSFGAFYEGECAETVDSPFCFTGQWRDAEIDQYDLRAREYDPAMMRFMTRDPVRGQIREPLSLHRYLYCLNEPSNNIDSSGASAIQIANGLRAATAVYAAGLGIAAYGAEHENFDMIGLGAFVQQLSPLAFALAYINTGSLVQVTRWGGDFGPDYYGIQGGPSFFNYLKTMKWLPSFPGHQFASFADSTTAYYLADTLYMPSGALGYIDIMFSFVKVPF
jgi:RHS repeat-associated protein